MDNSLVLSLTLIADVRIRPHAGCAKSLSVQGRESPSVTELRAPRGDLSVGMGDVLPKNKV